MPLNEGQTVQYTVVTTRVADGTVLYWRTTGNTTNSDIVGGNTGSVTITNNQGVFNVTPTLDLVTDGTKTLGIALSTGSVSGPTVVSTASPIIVEDTSVPPIVRLYSWGNNDIGQLGLNNTITTSSPVQVGTGTDWTNLNRRGATKADGTLWLWGYNNYGELGVGDSGGVANKSSPVQVAGTNWNRFAGGMATKTDGTLWLWGRNNYGQLGLNNRNNQSSPAQVAGTNWNKIVSSDGNENKFAIKTDGTLWSWGRNFSGQLGLNTVSNYAPRSSPTQVGTNTDWSEISGGSSVWAIKTNGTLWAWGFNGGGRLGLNDASARSSPTQVGTEANWSKVTAGGSTHLAIKTDGTLWACGANDWGQLGQNNPVYRSSPVQVGTTTNWSEINTGDQAVIAVKTNGTLWTWGFNRNGVLGNNNWQPFNGGNVSSPVQIGSNNNWSLGVIGNNGFAHAITAR
jgi:alpha-tubulin suppressor-like RCC1 family protein